MSRPELSAVRAPVTATLREVLEVIDRSALAVALLVRASRHLGRPADSNTVFFASLLVQRIALARRGDVTPTRR